MKTNRISNIKIRTFVVGSLMVFFWGLIVVKFFFIQVIKNEAYRTACRVQSRDSLRIEPQRGNFYDRNQNQLTSNTVLHNIGVNTGKIKSSSRFLKFLKRHFPETKNYTNQILASSSGTFWIARDTTVSRTVIDSLRYFPAAILDKKINRNYHSGASTGSLLGYTSGNRGITGLERTLDDQLSGLPGWRLVEKDGRGNVRPLYNRPYRKAINGNQVILTLDHNYQTILYEEVKHAFDKYNADNAKGIIIKPSTGEILAMVSCPSFDPNNRRNISPESLKNRVITDIYEPGSTFKVVTATSALEKKSVLPEDTIHCEKGEITIRGRTIHDHEKYPAMTFREVIQHSSNVGSILAAQKTGPEHLFRLTTKFGFGTKTNFIIDKEEEGILPPFHKWTDLRTAQIAMGHGISCTVLQLAYAYGAIANGGKLMQPNIIKEVRTPDGQLIKKYKPCARRRVASEKTMRTLRSILRDVVAEGTGTKANIQGMSIAGKTGTAQKVTENGYSHSEYDASFAGFFPASDPKLVAVVVVDNPKGAIYYGGYVAAPVVRNVFKRIVNASNDRFFNIEKKLQIASTFEQQNTQKEIERNDQKIPDDEKETKKPVLLSNTDRIYSRNITAGKNTFEMPDVTGFPASRAIGALQRLGLKIKIKGSGKVVSQYPQKGRTVKKGNTCILNLKS